jgi:hypothetical protein
VLRQFDVVIERDKQGFYVASVPQIPACHTQARSLDEIPNRIKVFDLPPSFSAGLSPRPVRARDNRAVIVHAKPVSPAKPFPFTTISPNRINHLPEIPTRVALHWRW